MKKFLSILLALVIVLSLATVTFADGDDGDNSPVETPHASNTVNYGSTTETTFKEIVKTYTSTNNVVVNENLSFTSTASASNPDGGSANLTVDDLPINSTNFNVASGNNAALLNVKIPALSVAGTYEWTIKETAGNTAGVTYSTDEVHVIVYVGYDNSATTKTLKILNTTSYIKKEGGNKAKTFTNTFKSGSFTVAKDVIGNMANENDEFEITVTLTSTKPIGTNITVAGTTVAPSQWTTNYKQGTTTVENYTYTSKMNYSDAAGAKTFSDIPTGVTVTVAETITVDKMNGYEQVGIYSGDYTVSDTTVSGTTFTTLTVADGTNTKITVVNKNTATIDTGITLDSMPYFVMLSVACVGMFLLLTKKRANREF